MLEKSKKYDEKVVKKCMAGPNALYLTEELTESMDLREDMLILDLGCGRALSSMFLAREYGVTVYAADVQFRAGENYAMLKDMGLDGKVFPIEADAAALPIMPGMLDGLVCVNAYHNFGMEHGFFARHLRPLLKPGAQVGLVLPATDEGYATEEGKEETQPAFWSAASWRKWFDEDLDIQVCQQLDSTQKAWQEWIAVSSMAAEEGETVHATLNPRLALVKIVGTVK